MNHIKIEIPPPSDDLHQMYAITAYPIQLMSILDTIQHKKRMKL